MSENIISPAPAQVSVNGISSYQVNDNEKSGGEEEKIKDLRQTLRVFKNIAQPIVQYIEFQQIMDPKLRIIIDVNQWIILMLAGKAAITSLIETDYADISDPPDDITESMHHFHDNIDNVSNAFITSMKEIVTLMQSQIFPSPI